MNNIDKSKISFSPLISRDLLKQLFNAMMLGDNDKIDRLIKLIEDYLSERSHQERNDYWRHLEKEIDKKYKAIEEKNNDIEAANKAYCLIISEIYSQINRINGLQDTY